MFRKYIYYINFPNIQISLGIRLDGTNGTMSRNTIQNAGIKLGYLDSWQGIYKKILVFFSHIFPI